MPNDTDRPLGEGLADQTLTPTSPEEWGARPVAAEQGFIATLPSGNVVRMRRTLDLPILLRAGKIPNPLADIVRQMLDTGNTQFPREAAEDSTALQQLLDLIDQNCVNAVIEPKVSAPDPRGINETFEEWQERANAWLPEPGTLSVFRIDMPDKLYIYAVAQGAAANLARFRDESEGFMAGLADEQDVPSEAVGTPGANRAQRRAATKSAKKPAKQPAKSAKKSASARKKS
jgi:hypothetical protein